MTTQNEKAWKATDKIGLILGLIMIIPQLFEFINYLRQTVTNWTSIIDTFKWILMIFGIIIIIYILAKRWIVNRYEMKADKSEILINQKFIEHCNKTIDELNNNFITIDELKRGYVNSDKSKLMVRILNNEFVLNTNLQSFHLSPFNNK